MCHSICWVRLFSCGEDRILVSGSMSDEEHHFESKADAGASKTYPQQAGTIRKNGYIVIKGRACKVMLDSIFLLVLIIFS